MEEEFLIDSNYSVIYYGDEYEKFGLKKADAAHEAAGNLPTGSCESEKFQEEMREYYEKVLSQLNQKPVCIRDWRITSPACSGSKTCRVEYETV